MSAPEDLLPPQHLRIMQIIASTLFGSVAAFLVVVLFIVLVQNNGQGIGAPAGLPMVSLVAAVLFVVNLFLAFLLPGVQTRAALRQVASGAWRLPVPANPNDYGTDTAKLLAVRQTTLIVALAMLEGTALLGCIAFLLEAQMWVLGIIIVTLLLMLVNFPTEARVSAWLQEQTDRLAELRQQQGPVN